MMLGWVTGKVKTVLLGLALAVGPILYALGLMRGKNKGHVESLKRDNARQKSIADFYREMDGFDEESIRPSNRNDLVERLRDGKF